MCYRLSPRGMWPHIRSCETASVPSSTHGTYISPLHVSSRLGSVAICHRDIGTGPYFSPAAPRLPSTPLTWCQLPWLFAQCHRNHQTSSSWDRCTEPPWRIPLHSFAQFLIENRGRATWFGTGGRVLRHTMSARFNRMFQVRNIPCTRSGSGLWANLKPCRPLTLAATFLLLYRQNQLFLLSSSNSEISLLTLGHSDRNHRRMVPRWIPGDNSVLSEILWQMLILNW
jgi:hypothetical protein